LRCSPRPGVFSAEEEVAGATGEAEAMTSIFQVETTAGIMAEIAMTIIKRNSQT
jgi:hypothetical protein